MWNLQGRSTHLERKCENTFKDCGAPTLKDGALKFIEGFYPVSEIVVRLKKAEEDEDKMQWCADHADAVERFWDSYKRNPVLRTPLNLTRTNPPNRCRFRAWTKPTE